MPIVSSGAAATCRYARAGETILSPIWPHGCPNVWTGPVVKLPHVDPEQRRRIMANIALQPPPGWNLDFAVMMTLSVVVAALGLLADSVAVVIGAMLLAPLMTPVLGTAAALAMALPRHALRSAARVAGGMVLAVAVAVAIAFAAPAPELTGEILARTSPDLSDLLIALAAGAGGAYAAVRPNVADSVTGVAVAVALVPPLATVGITLQAGQPDLAQGAFVLFLANLAAIVLSGVIVFVAMGLVPSRRLREQRRLVMGGAVASLVATAAIAVPLVAASRSAIELRERRTAVTLATERWLTGTSIDVTDLKVDGTLVSLRLAGPQPPPSVKLLASDLSNTFGSVPTMDVRWFQSTDGMDADLPGTAAASERAAAEPDLVEAAVADWIGADAKDWRVGGVRTVDDELVIDLRSPEPPPAVSGLSERLERRLGEPVAVRVDWTRQLSLSSAVTTDDELLAIEAEMVALIEAWSSEKGNPELGNIELTSTALNIDLVGVDQGDVEPLRSDLVAALADLLPQDSEVNPAEDVAVNIFLVPRIPITAP